MYKWWLAILVVACMCFWQGKSWAQTNTVTSTSSTVSGTNTVDRTVGTANAPSFGNNNQDVCSYAASAAIQTQILGVAGGTSIRDMNCERLKLSRALYRMGMKVGAVAMLCQDARVWQAMTMAGTPCPFKGKIGIDAAKAWAENPEMRPDYDKWVKENVTDADWLPTEEEAVGLSIGGSLLLLLLLL